MYIIHATNLHTNDAHFHHVQNRQHLQILCEVFECGIDVLVVKPISFAQLISKKN